VGLACDEPQRVPWEGTPARTLGGPGILICMRNAAAAVGSEYRSSVRTSGARWVSNVTPPRRVVPVTATIVA